MAKTGRPKASSRETLEEAASELFFEKGYDHTSVDDIAERAGVSRATFFNYFPSKADVLCVEIDRALERLHAALDAGLSLHQAIAEVCRQTTTIDIPLIVSQAETMGLPHEIDGVLPTRLLRLKTLISRAVADPVAQWAVTGALVEAALSWAQQPEHSSLHQAIDAHLSRLQETVFADLQERVP